MSVPGIGEVFRITNPGEGIGENVLRDFAGCTNCPNQPKPTRNYDGVEFRFVKRLSNRWALTSTYLYSRLYGNYSGLTSSDENNRNSPSVNRFFDGQFYSFDRFGKPVFGFLQTDRPHVFKIEGAYDLPWGTGVGLYWLAESGTPMQTEMREQGIPFFPFGRGDLGRTPTLTRTDLSIRHDFSVWNGNAIEVGMNIENLLDQDFITRLVHAAVSRHLQRAERDVLQRHVRSGCDPGGGARDVPSRRAVRQGGSVSDAARDAGPGPV